MSSEEDSDVEYCPESEEPDILTDNETDYDEDGNKINNSKTVNKKRKKKQTKQNRSKRKNDTNTKDNECKESSSLVTINNDEEEKTRAEELWANFLNDTSSSLGSKGSKQETIEPPATETKDTCLKPRSNIEKIINHKEKQITTIFEFAGEKIEAPDIQPSDIKPQTINQASGLSSHSKMASSKIGLGSVLSQLGKKSKISTLEKSKLDWKNFKQQQGLEEEIETFNKGKDGYLERQDFLERTDFRQFEQEKSLRQTKRSHR